jgi:virginiamycin B lyase
MRLRASIGAIVLFLSACSGGSHSGTYLPPSDKFAATTAPMTTRVAEGKLVVRVTLRSPRFRPNYVSVASKGMSVRIVGLENVKKTVSLASNAAGCKGKLMTRACELEIPGLKNCPSRKNCYSATITIYDAFDAKTHKIPAGAQVLSRVENVGFKIKKGTTEIPIVLQGVPASVAFVPAASSSLYQAASGFVLPKCGTSKQKVSVFGVDADGNYIVGPGAPRAALSSDDSAQLAVSAAALQADAFELAPPTSPEYPHGNHTIRLTATATPGAQSGGAARSSTIGVTYSGDICGVFTNFPIPTPSSGPEGITVGRDGNIWFVESNGNKVGRITTAGKLTEFTLPVALSLPRYITAGPDGNLWFTENNAKRIGKITTGGSLQEFPLSTEPAGIVTGPDGNLWITEFSAVAKMTPGGSVTTYPVTTNSDPTVIVVGPDKNLWFAEFNPPRQVGRMTTAGALTEYPIPSGGAPVGIAVGSDGALWVGDYTAQVSRITTGGVFTSAFPVGSSGGLDRNIAAGPDGALWFQDGAAFGRITTSGITSDVSVPPGYQSPFDLTTGPDGAIWFTEFFYQNTGMIGRLY